MNGRQHRKIEKLRHINRSTKTAEINSVTSINTNGPTKPQKQTKSNLELLPSRPLLEQKFSGFIHNSLIETLSDSLTLTLFRPFSMLVAVICCMLVTLASIIITSQYGYDYNFLFSILAYLAGYILGMIGELFVTLLKK